MTSAEPSPTRPDSAADGALFDALATEHAIIYGYGIVSARSAPDDNYLVAEAIAEHRERREAALTMMEERSTAVPLPAAGYQLPLAIDSPAEAVKLAVQMEEDAAEAWRAVVEQAGTEQDRAFGVTALCQCAVLAARWRRLLGVSPVTVAFPGGSE